MGVNRAHDRLGSRLVRERQPTLGDQFGDARTNHVDAEDLIVLFVGDNLDEPLPLPKDGRLAVAGEREFANLHVVPLLTRLRFGQPDAGDLRVAVGA